MSELLPCPFCGSTDIDTEGPCYDAFMCNGCGVSQYDQPGHAEAIAAWNTRTSQAELERLTTLEAELWRLSLVIESAVRNADWPNHADVLALIKSIKRPDTALSGSKE